MFLRTNDIYEIYIFIQDCVFVSVKQREKNSERTIIQQIFQIVNFEGWGLGLGGQEKRKGKMFPR